jgi:hypothetical protein
MDIQTLGNLGDFIGSLAVLVTLIYLAIQTRQTVTIARQTSLSDILERRQELMAQLMDRDFIEVWGKGCSKQQLDSLDAQRFTSFAISFLSHVQDVYIQFKADLIDEKVWEAERRLIAVSFTQPGFLDWWQHGQQFVTEEFAREIEKSPTTYFVLYDPEACSWGRPEGGIFARNAQIVKSE